MEDGNAPARPAISERGEFSLALGGEELALRPTYEAIEAFELGTGRGLVELAQRALSSRMTTGEAAIVATESIRAFGRDENHASAKGANTKKVARLIIDGPGFHAALETIAAMLSLATTGGYDSAGKLKPAPTMPTPDGTGDD